MILTSSGSQDSNGRDIRYSDRQLRAPDLVEDKQRTTEICHDLLEIDTFPCFKARNAVIPGVCVSLVFNILSVMQYLCNIATHCENRATL
jgi:hypothetical protein